MTRTGVVVVTYNSAEVIERCLESCGDLPVVVVDNASRMPRATWFAGAGL
jgi:glycosyltransferase involved in cell wall biosynthesis